MIKVVTSDEMRGIDRRTIEGHGLPGAVLMERAGLKVAEKVLELYGRKKVLVLAGAGNNGGDGLVAARELHNAGCNVKVLLLAKENKLSPDCKVQLRIAKKFGVPVELRTTLGPQDLHSAVVIDAIFGTGLSRPVTGRLAQIIEFVNSADTPVVSVDIPSGISSDSGRVLGEAFKADVTVTFGLPKLGHYLHPGAEYCGRLFIEDIGFPQTLTKSDNLMTSLVEKEDAAMLLPQRLPDSHKGDYGHVLILAGSRGKPGAALMAAKACMRAGAGIVTLGVPEGIADIVQARVTEEMVLPLPEDSTGAFSSDALEKALQFIGGKVDVCAAGPGMRVTAGTRHLISGLVSLSTVPLVLDADAINTLQGGSEVLKKAKSPVILTPHIGEMSRLLDIKRTELLSDLPGAARRFAIGSASYLVLKGAPTLIASPEGELFINTTGNPGMSTAGSGDVLTGLIAGLLGQSLLPVEAALLGVYLHGLSGDMASGQKGQHSLIASDIIEALPQAYHSLLTLA